MKFKYCIYCCLALAVLIVSIIIAYYTSGIDKYHLDIIDTTEYACVSEIKHCGCCGACSNIVDYKVYAENSDLTEDARHCALDRLFESTKPCFENLGLTEGCSACWAENVECTKEHCWFPCMMETFLGVDSSTKDSLSRCLACDEKNCGPAFASCAGMTRRRAGILTDINRDSKEICILNFTKNGSLC